jgi:hypothetical protein
LLGALVVVPHVLEPDRVATAAAQGSTTGFTKVPPGLDLREAARRPAFVSCDHEPASNCTVVSGDRPSLLLIGDSHAAMLTPTFAEIARREHLTLSVATRGACPWQRRLYPSKRGGRRFPAAAREGCDDHRDDVYDRLIPALRPDVIIAMDIEYGPRAEKPTVDSLAELRASSAQVVLVEPIPLAGIDPRECLSTAKVLEECRYVARPPAGIAEKLYRRLAESDDGVYSMNLDRLVCPFLPICDPVIDGHIVKWDSTHLTTDFARSLAPELAAIMVQSRILSKPK